MTRFSPKPMSALAALALAGCIALAQEPASPAPPAPAAPAENSQPPAPIERHANRIARAPMPPNARTIHGGPMMERFHHMHEEGMGGGPFHIGPGGMWWKRTEVAQRLNLSADQVKRMDDIFQQSRIKLIDLHANVEKQEVMLEPMLSANPVDTAKAQAQIDKVADARAELEKANARMLLSIRGVLTPDQWAKLSEQHRTGRGFGVGTPGPVAPPGTAAPGGPGPHPSALERVDGPDAPDFSM